jgi:hypothetical protein
VNRLDNWHRQSDEKEKDESSDYMDQLSPITSRKTYE